MPKPSPVLQKFFDFYSIYELYLRCGGFRQEGYANYDTFVNERVFDAVNETYEKTVDSFYEEVYWALLYSIKTEVRHFPRKCAMRRDWGEWRYYRDYNQGQFYKKLQSKTGIDKSKFIATKKAIETDEAAVADNPYIVRLMFSAPHWEESYGGKAWAKAAKLVEEAKKVTTRTQKVGWIDKAMDLQHNTGFLLNKTHFKKLSEHMCHPESGRPIIPLNFRARAKSILKFLPFNSPRVKNLVTARKRLLT